VRKVSLSGRAEDIASARLWLADGVPIVDILTMLEVRHRFDLSPADARTYAVEILWAIQHPIESRNPHAIPAPKEVPYATA